MPITSALAPDLEAVRRFLLEMIARRAFAELVAAVLALLARMRDLNTELMARVAGNSRHRPPSETMHRLQLELPLRFGPAANDDATPPSLVPPTPPPPSNTREKKKRGPKNRH